jgi:hypothetical protein
LLTVSIASNKVCGAPTCQPTAAQICPHIWSTTEIGLHTIVVSADELERIDMRAGLLIGILAGCDDQHLHQHFTQKDCVLCFEKIQKEH